MCWCRPEAFSGVPTLFFKSSGHNGLSVLHCVATRSADSADSQCPGGHHLQRRACPAHRLTGFRACPGRAPHQETRYGAPAATVQPRGCAEALRWGAAGDSAFHACPAYAPPSPGHRLERSAQLQRMTTSADALHTRWTDPRNSARHQKLKKTKYGAHAACRSVYLIKHEVFWLFFTTTMGQRVPHVRHRSEALLNNGPCHAADGAAVVGWNRSACVPRAPPPPRVAAEKPFTDGVGSPPPLRYAMVLTASRAFSVPRLMSAMARSFPLPNCCPWSCAGPPGQENGVWAGGGGEPGPAFKAPAHTRVYQSMGTQCALCHQSASLLRCPCLTLGPQQTQSRSLGHNAGNMKHKTRGGGTRRCARGANGANRKAIVETHPPALPSTVARLPTPFPGTRLPYTEAGHVEDMDSFLSESALCCSNTWSWA